MQNDFDSRIRKAVADQPDDSFEVGQKLGRVNPDLVAVIAFVQPGVTRTVLHREAVLDVVLAADQNQLSAGDVVSMTQQVFNRLEKPRFVEVDVARIVDAERIEAVIFQVLTLPRPPFTVFAAEVPTGDQDCRGKYVYRQFH